MDVQEWELPVRLKVAMVPERPHEWAAGEFAAEPAG